MKQLRLSQQTMLLVLVPVIFELVFVGWLYMSLSEVEKQAEQAEEARVLATHMNRFLRLMMEVVGQKKFDTDRVRPIDPHQAIKGVQQELETIEEMVQDKPAERKMVRQIKELLTETAIMAESLNNHTRNGDIAKAYEMRASIRPLLHKMGANIEAMRKTQEKLEEAAPHIVSQRRELIRNILIFGVTFNIALAVMLALFVYRNVVFRLGILYDNARAFEENKPLRPSPGGDDEIATVDSAFRQMANSLYIARTMEQSENERLTQIIHGLPLGLAMVDEDGTISLANDALATMLLRTDDLKNVPLQQIFDSEVSLQSLKKSTGLNAIKADGRTFPAEVAATFIDTREGRKVLVMVVDISERLAVEQMKQQFIAFVSHELRTPLTSVENYLDMVKEGIYGKLSDSGMESLTGVQAGVERLIRLTRDLLDVERLEAGQLQLDIRKTDLARVFRESLHAVSGVSSNNGVTVDVPNNSASVNADAERIVQVTVNLVSNAIKFTPKGGTVAVRLSSDNSYALIEVIDNGPGIAREYHEKIFDRFQQVNIDDAKKRGGSGLGLAICKLIVEQHNGAIGVKSEPGKGSTFWFTLPLA